jgi:hypothetical protein
MQAIPPGYWPPGAPGWPEAPAPPKRQKGPLIAILSLIVLVVLLGGGLFFVLLGRGFSPGQSSSPTQAPTATALPTATATPSAPPGYQFFTNSMKTFSIDYPLGWSESKAPASAGDGGEFEGPEAQTFLATDGGAIVGDPAVFDDAFCEGVNGNGGFGGKPTAPKQVVVAGQTWTEEECTNSANAHAAVETIIYKGHSFIIAYASLSGSFAINRSQYFSVMEQSFNFLT